MKSCNTISVAHISNKSEFGKKTNIKQNSKLCHTLSIFSAYIFVARTETELPTNILNIDARVSPDDVFHKVSVEFEIFLS